MQVGDKIIYFGIEYTIWLIEDETLHLIDKKNNGIAILNTEIL